ncbi:MAG: SRPBCC domain-containing protein [Anaerolinea sp.]|nr:SRPBCC domain-containing protein [Anaerolinea sp.]
MKEIRSEIDINTSAQNVWQVLTALDEYPEWNPFLHHAIGKAEIGENVDIIFKFGSKDMTLHCKVVKVEPNRELRWKYHVGLPILYQGEHCFEIKSIGANQVHFIDKEIFTGLLVPFLVKEDDRGGFEAMDQALKTRVEKLMMG